MKTKRTRKLQVSDRQHGTNCAWCCHYKHLCSKRFHCISNRPKGEFAMKGKITRWQFLVWWFGFDWLKCVSISSSHRLYWWFNPADRSQWFAPRVGFLFWDTPHWRRKRPRASRTRSWAHFSHRTSERLWMGLGPRAKNHQEAFTAQHRAQVQMCVPVLGNWHLS